MGITTLHSLNRNTSKFFFFFSLLGFFAVLSSPAFAQWKSDLPAKNSTDKTVGGSPVYERMMTNANTNGSVKIIVGLNVDWNPGVQGAAGSAQIASIENTQQGVLDSLNGLGVSQVKRYQHVPQMAMNVTPQALQAFGSNPRIAHIWEDQLRHPSLGEAGPLIGADTAWTTGYTGAGQTVAILDTGVDKTHSFLSGKVVSEACYSSTDPLYDSTSACPGGVQSSTAAGSGVDCNAAYSGCDHGTHVAGIAAGKDPGGLGYSGVAKDASVIAIQVFSYFSAAACGGPLCVMSWDSDQISGLDRVYALRSTYSIAAVNMSLGGGRSFTNCDLDALKTSIDNLRAVGIATVIASGNDGYKTSMGSPACISTAISVGATCDNGTSSSCATGVDGVASYSNIASFISLLAPGSLITSSVPGGTYQSWNGTSMATPMVTGAWAAMKQAKGTASVAEVLAAFQSTGASINDSRTGGSVTGMKRINLDLATNQIILASPSPSDFNGDNSSDLVWRNSATGANVIWYMNGAAAVSYDSVQTVSDTSWQIVGNGDFNGDGTPDLVWRNNVTGVNAVWYMNGALLASYDFFLPVPYANWQIVGVGDFNNDTKPDLVWRDSVSGANQVWYMNGAVRTSYENLQTVPYSNWQIVGVGDFNNDTKPDLVWRDSVSGANQIWYMDGVNRTSYENVQTVADTSWEIVGVGDFNGDTKSDLVWRNNITGVNAVWYMNGAALTSYELVQTVGDTNWQIVN